MRRLVVKPRPPGILRAGHPLARGLVGGFALLEGGGTHVRNLNRTKASGTANAAATWGTLYRDPRFVGQDLEFDGGSNGEVTTGSVLGLDGAGETVACRAYVRSSSERGAFVKVGSTAVGYALGSGSGTLDSPGDELIVLYENVRWIATAVALGGAGWKDVAIVLNASGHPTVYLAGRQVYSDTTGGPLTPDSNVYLGGYTAGGAINRHFTGGLQYAYLWDRALSAAEIARVAADPFDVCTPRPEWATGIGAAAGGGGGATTSIHLPLLGVG